MAPMSDLLADLRRGLPLLVVATLAGAAVAGGLALREGVRQVSTATLLVTSRSPEARGAPMRPGELEALLGPELLGRAAEAAGVPPEELAGAVAVAQRPNPGLYDLSVTLVDGEAARKAADALARDLAALVQDLRTRKLDLAQASLSPGFEEARKAREEAEVAYLAHVDAGTVEGAKAANDRSPSAVHAAAYGRAKAERERLRLALDRAATAERWAADARARTGFELDAREPRASVWAEAGPPSPRRRSTSRAAVSGGALAFAVAFGGVLVLREFRRRPPAQA